jgi:hypothetical protein
MSFGNLTLSKRVDKVAQDPLTQSAARWGKVYRGTKERTTATSLVDSEKNEHRRTDKKIRTQK